MTVAGARGGRGAPAGATGRKRLDTAREGSLDSAGGQKGITMRRFLAGLLLGVACMYWYAYHKDAFLVSVKQWFADASADPEAAQKIDKMVSRRR